MPRSGVLLIASLLLAATSATATAQVPSATTEPALAAGEPGLSPLRAPEQPAPASYFQATAAQPPPQPSHTGFGALLRETGKDFASFPRRPSTWVILAIGGGAAALAHPWDDEINENLQDSSGLRNFMKPGKYIGSAWFQGSAAVGLYLIGRYAMAPEQGTHTNKVSHLGFDLIRSTIVSQALTFGIKVAVRRDRPTGECCAFPSGHASLSFASASVIERHFGARGSLPMFAIAGYVAASRLTENRHFASDVLFGSALGLASGWTVVGRHGRENFALYPVPVKGGVALAGSWTPSIRPRRIAAARGTPALRQLPPGN